MEGYEESTIYERERQGNLIIQRKRDGFQIRGARSKGRTKLYTSGNVLIDARVQHICDALDAAFDKLGIEVALFTAEGIFDKDKNDSYRNVSRFFKSRLQDAMTIQKQNGMIKLMLFGITLWDGEHFTGPYEDVVKLLQNLAKTCKGGYILPPPILAMTFDQAKELVRTKKWEGLVLYAKDFRAQHRIDGRDPKRPKGCEKWKLIYEDDFIVRAVDRKWNPDDSTKLKDVVLHQIDPMTGQEFSCGRLGSFNKETRALLSDAKNFPLVMKVLFEDRFAKTGKLRNARLESIRDDKPLEHCIASQSYTEAEYSK